jgi:hypothetical protein
MVAFLWPLVSWMFRGVVINFVVMTAVYAVMALFIPLVINYLLPYLGVSSLTSAFSAVSPGVWWILDIAALNFGVPLIIGAFIARFLIRRIPVIG